MTESHDRCPLTYSREVYWLLSYRCTEGAGKCQHTSRSRKQTLTWYFTCLVVNNIPWDCTNWTSLNPHFSSTGEPSEFRKVYKLEWLGYHVLKKCVKPFRHNTGTWRTDGQTELLNQYCTSALLCWRDKNTVHCFIKHEKALRQIVGLLPYANNHNTLDKILGSCMHSFFLFFDTGT